MLINERFKSPNKEFEKVFNLFRKKDYFSEKSQVKKKQEEFVRFLKKGDPMATKVFKQNKEDMKSSLSFIEDMVMDYNKKNHFEAFQIFSTAVNDIEMKDSKSAEKSGNFIKSKIHNNSQKYSLAIYSAIRKQKFNNYKDVHKDVDELISKNEGFSSDAQRKAAFANGYEEKGKKKNESVTEAKLNHYRITGNSIEFYVKDKGKNLVLRFKDKRDFDKLKLDLDNPKDLQKILAKRPNKMSISMGESVNEVGKGSNWAEKYVNDTNLYKKLNWYMKMGKGAEKKIKGKEFVIMSDGSALIWNTKTSDWKLYKPKRIDKKTGKPIYESVNEAKVNYNFSENELKRVLKLLGRNASTEVKMIKAFEKAFGRKLTRDELFESVNEGKKRYYQQDRVGSAKYTISYHDGKKKHNDGSDFFDIQTFKNKKDLAKFVNTLHKGGYVYGFNESVNEASKLAMGIAGFTGTRGIAVDDFIQKNKIDAKKLFNFVKKGNLKDRMALVSAIAGKPNNKMFKMITKQFSESTDGVPQGYNPMVEDKKQIKDLVKKVKHEKLFYDVLDTMEKKYGKRQYRIWLEKSLKGFGVNPKHYDYRTNAAAEEKLFQLGK